MKQIYSTLTDVIQFSLVFNFKGAKPNKHGKNAIWIRVYQTGKQRYYSSKIYIEEHHWDSKKSEVKKSHPHYVALNRQLRKQIQELEDLQVNYILKDIPFTLDSVKNFLHGGKQIKLFTSFMEFHIENDQTKVKSTLTTHRSTLRLFRKIIGHDIFFHDLTYNNIYKFHHELLRMGYHHNTVHKHHKHLKVYIHLAIKMELLDEKNNPYIQFKVSTIRTEKEALNGDEVRAIESLGYNEGSINQFVKDVFLFGCYTGLRISDIMRLSNEHIFENDKGVFIDKFESQKTGKMIYLPLFSMFNENGVSKPIQILNKYKTATNEPIFFRYAPQTINLVLKKIAIDAGITKKVVFHRSRDTFASILLNEKGVPITIVKQIMQHSKIETTMSYVDVNKSTVNSSLKDISW